MGKPNGNGFAFRKKRRTSNEVIADIDLAIARAEPIAIEESSNVGDVKDEVVALVAKEAKVSKSRARSNIRFKQMPDEVGSTLFTCTKKGC